MSHFDENFERIFGMKKPQRGRFIQHPETGELIPADEYVRPSSVNAPSIMKPLDEFTSPVDGQRISSRKQLAEHNRRHGVTDMRDYSQGYIESRAKQRIEQSKRELKQSRVRDIKHAIDKHQR